MDERMPQTIGEVETKHCASELGKLAPTWPAIIIGGLMAPANMDKVC